MSRKAGLSTLRVVASLFCCLVFLPLGALAFEAPFSVTEPAGLARTSEPISGGIPLPEGQFHYTQDFAVYRQGGSEIAAQVLPLVVNTNGYLRWVLVDFQDDLSANGTKNYVLKDVSPTVNPPNPIQVTQGGGSITVDTGPMNFTVGTNAAFKVFDEVKINGNAVVNGGELFYEKVDISAFPNADKLSAGVPTRAEVVYEGPMRVTIEVEGYYQNDTDKSQYKVWITTWAGSSRVWLKDKICNTNPDQQTLLPVKRKAITLDLADAGGDTVFGADVPRTIGSGATEAYMHKGLKYEDHYQTVTNHTKVGSDSSVAWWGSGSSDALEGWIAVEGNRPVYAWDRYMRLRYPCRLAKEGSKLVLEVMSEHFPAQPDQDPANGDRVGDYKDLAAQHYWMMDCAHYRSEYMLDFDPPAIGQGYTNLWKNYRSRLWTLPDPTYVQETESVIIGDFGTQQDEIATYSDWGMWYDSGIVPSLSHNPGIYRHREGIHFDTETDSAHSLLMMYMRTGDRGYFDEADAWARYDADLGAWRTDGWRWKDGAIWFPGGGPQGNRLVREEYASRAALPDDEESKVWNDYLERRNGRHCYCHTYGAGLALYYCMTGDRDSRDAVLDQADVKNSEMRDYMNAVPGQTSPNSIRAYGRGFQVAMAAMIVKPDDEFVKDLVDLYADVTFQSPALDQRGFLYNARTAASDDINGWDDVIAQENLVFEYDSLGNISRVSNTVSGASWRPKYFSGTWQHIYIQNGADWYARIFDDDDMRDFTIGFAKMSERFMLSDKCHQTWYKMSFDVVHYGDVHDKWIHQHASTTDGEGCIHKGHYTRFYPDACAKGYSWCGDSSLLTKARDFWYYGSKRYYHTTSLSGASNEIVRFAEYEFGHAEGREDSVLTTARLFYHWGNPRADTQAPDAITDLQVHVNGEEAIITFTAPSDNGGSGVAKYQVKCSDRPILPYEQWDQATHETTHRNWWCADNVSGEPVPGSPGTVESFTVSGVPQEAAHFVVRSYDAQWNMSGCSTMSANIAPTVSLTSPADNTGFASGESIILEATAEDTDGSISKVEFFADETKIGEDTTSPYSYTWNDAGDGSYVISAKATDNNWGVGLSNEARIWVGNTAISIAGDQELEGTNTLDLSDGTGIAENDDGVYDFGDANGDGSRTDPVTSGSTSMDLGVYKLWADNSESIHLNLNGVGLTGESGYTSFRLDGGWHRNLGIYNVRSISIGAINGTSSTSGHGADVLIGEAEGIGSGPVPGDIRIDSIDCRAGSDESYEAGSVTIYSGGDVAFETSGGVKGDVILIKADRNRRYGRGDLSVYHDGAFRAGRILLYGGKDSDSEDRAGWLDANGDYKGDGVSSGDTFEVDVLRTGDNGGSHYDTGRNGRLAVSNYASVLIGTLHADNDSSVVIDEIHGNITVIDPLDGHFVDGTTRKSSLYLGTSSGSGGNVTVSDLDLNELTDCTFAPDGTATVNGKLSGFVTGGTGSGTAQDPVVTTQQLLQVESGKTLYYDPNDADNSYLGSKYYQVSDLSGAPGQGGTLAPSDGTGNNSPTVSITSPSDGATYPEGDNVTIDATASDSDGSVTKVEFYEDGNLLGEVTSSPYSYTWTSVPQGSHTLTAKATDDDSATTTSSGVGITVDASGGGATTNELFAVADAFVQAGAYSSDNYGATAGLNVKYDGDTSDWTRNAYLRFDLSSVGTNVSSATLKVYCESVWDSTDTHGLQFVSDDSWTETGITWDNAPAGSGTDETTWMPQEGAFVEIDVTSLVQSEQGGDMSVMIHQLDLANGVTYTSRDSTNTMQHPRLVVVTSGGTNTINFNDYTIQTYDTAQDAGSADVLDGGATLKIYNNAWKKIDYPYTVTTNTMLEFDFKASSEVEIQGIGFDDDDSTSSNKTFRVYGTQDWGIGDYSYTGGGTYQSFSIPVGNHFTGSELYLIFACDDDASGGGEAYFSNVRGYESGGENSSMLRDNDGDGVPDALDDDDDNDGLSDADELIAGTDPYNKESCLRIGPVDAESSGQEVVFSFDSVSGKTYSGEFTEDIVGGQWLVLDGNIVGTGGVIEIRDSLGVEKRFYRVRVVE